MIISDDPNSTHFEFYIPEYSVIMSVILKVQLTKCKNLSGENRLGLA